MRKIICILTAFCFIFAFIPTDIYAEGERMERAKQIKTEIQKHRKAIHELRQELKGLIGAPGRGGWDEGEYDEEYADEGDYVYDSGYVEGGTKGEGGYGAPPPGKRRRHPKSKKHLQKKRKDFREKRKDFREERKGPKGKARGWRKDKGPKGKARGWRKDKGPKGKARGWRKDKGPKGKGPKGKARGWRKDKGPIKGPGHQISPYKAKGPKGKGPRGKGKSPRGKRKIGGKPNPIHGGRGEAVVHDGGPKRGGAQKGGVNKGAKRGGNKARGKKR